MATAYRPPMRTRLKVAAGLGSLALVLAVCSIQPKPESGAPLSYDDLMRSIGQQPTKLASGEPIANVARPSLLGALYSAAQAADPRLYSTPEPPPPMRRAERRAERRAILAEISRIHDIGSGIMKHMRESKDLAMTSQCQRERETEAPRIASLMTRVADYDAEDFQMKLAADTLRLCAACSSDATFHCGQVAKYLKGTI